MALVESYKKTIDYIISKQNDKITNAVNFSKEINFDIDELYVKLFWTNLSKTGEIYLSNNLINTIGFKGKDDKHRLSNCVGFIRKIANESEGFKIVGVKDIYKYIDEGTECKTSDLSSRRNHHIVTPNCFKKLLFKSTALHAVMIYDNFVKVENLHELYNYYSQLYIFSEEKNVLINQIEQHKKNINMKNKEIKELSEKMLYSMPDINTNQHIYIITNKSHMKDNIFKIGRHTGTKIALIDRYNTTLPKPVILRFQPTERCNTDELQLQNLLKKNKYSGEWFNIDIDVLLNIYDNYFT